MTFSPLARMDLRIPDYGRSAPRQDVVRGMLYHHNAGVNAYSEATNPGREVGAQYWITNEGLIIPHVDEDRRAFTSGAVGYPEGALADHRSITLEISNSPEGVRNGTWAISAAAMEAVIAITVDVYLRYNLGSVTRGFYGGISVHRDFVPTQCPGGFIMDNLPAIIAEAERRRAGGGVPPTPEKDNDMPREYISRDTNGRKAKQILKPGVPTFIQHADNKTSGSSGAGDHILTFEAHFTGTPGAIIDLVVERYIWDAKKKAYTSRVYVTGSPRVVLDGSGKGKALVTATNRVPATGAQLGLRAEVAASSKGNVTVDRFAVKGYAFTV